MSKELKEHELPDDYPVYVGYLYVLDGTPARANANMTAAKFKQLRKATSIKNCDINGRDLWHLAI